MSINADGLTYYELLTWYNITFMAHAFTSYAVAVHGYDTQIHFILQLFITNNATSQINKYH